MGLFKSKKWLTAMGGVIAATVAYYFGIPEETIMIVLSPIIAYIIGQGVADINRQ